MTNEPSVATTNRVKLATSATVNDGVHCSPAGQTSIPPLRNLGALSLINRLSNLRASAFGSDQEKESQKTGVCVCVCTFSSHSYLPSCQHVYNSKSDLRRRRRFHKVADRTTDNFIAFIGHNSLPELESGENHFFLQFNKKRRNDKRNHGKIEIVPEASVDRSTRMSAALAVTQEKALLRCWANIWLAPRPSGRWA